VYSYYSKIYKHLNSSLRTKFEIYLQEQSMRYY